jgi:glycogen synthase
MPVPDPAVVRAIARCAESTKPDVAHSHTPISNSAFRPLGRRGIPLITTMHDYSQTCATKRHREQVVADCTGPGAGNCVRCSASKFGGPVGLGTLTGNAWMSRPRRNRTEQFLAVSNAMAERASPASSSSVAATGVRSRVGPNFIPDEMIVDPVPEPSQHAAIVFVGDLTKDKGVDVLVEAYAKLADPPGMILMRWITAETPDPLPAKVRSTGLLRHGEAMEYGGHARLLVVPSAWRDPCPTVVLEGMASGRPVVASATGGITDTVVDGETGLLVAPASPDDIAHALTTLLSAPHRAAVMGAAGRDWARSFTLSSVVDQPEDVYVDCVSRSRRVRVTAPA